jgi:hypothetical protein
VKLFKKDIKLETGAIRSVLDGSLFYKGLIKKNLLYMVFCTFLLIFYIGNRYKCEGQLTQIAKLEKEITDLRYESITSSAELMSISRQSEVCRLVKDRGIDLDESVKAPQRIYIKD